MSGLSDKVSYLRGLAEGMKLDETTNEGKLLSQIIAVLGEVSEKIDALDEAYEELSDYVECIDDDDEDEDGPQLYLEDGDDDDGDDDDTLGMYAGCLCSECGGMFSVDVGYNEDQLFICPHCSKRVKAVEMNCQNVPVAEATGEDEDDE